LNNVENRVAWFLVELCKKISETSAGQSSFLFSAPPKKASLVVKLFHGFIKAERDNPDFAVFSVLYHQQITFS
jgi:hypothetical protein